jgi:D-glycero-alpha-D-manno-heptose-7-phosphate kinase
MLIRSKAPLRLSFGGGGTDVPPYPQEHGGVVLSATINKYAFGTLEVGSEDAFTVESLDYDVVAKYHTEQDLAFDGKLDLVKAVVRRLLKDQPNRGLKLFLHSDAPPGSGLGSSSTLVVALIGLFKHWLRLPLTDYEIAELAYQIERKDLGIKGGMQDQYAAAFGGFNFIEFLGSTVVVNPLSVDLDSLNELEYNLLLVYTGHARVSDHILDRQIQSYVQEQGGVMAALDHLKAITVEMKKCLLKGRLNEFGALLDEEWRNKKQLDAEISNPRIDELYQAACREGALGGKLAGAGAGGYLLLYCQFDRKHRVAATLEKMGGQAVEFGFEPRGLQTWTVND